MIWKISADSWICQRGIILSISKDKESVGITKAHLLVVAGCNRSHFIPTYIRYTVLLWKPGSWEPTSTQPSHAHRECACVDRDLPSTISLFIIRDWSFLYRPICSTQGKSLSRNHLRSTWNRISAAPLSIMVCGARNNRTQYNASPSFSRPH